MASRQALSVLSLYKNILLLHRLLPLELKAVGDEYVKAEFRRHKKVKPEEGKKFMEEWQNYAAVLQDQLQQSQSTLQDVGVDLSETNLDELSPDQLGQLLELRKETSKPSPFVPPVEGPS
ncbi:succinate dehydrogenase assembly factor 3, mitochondrial-like [Asterias rubens]|uniref:succinate dehydrogenase assembly factor 3, mitochondrial-like n=1 Tax=Asterias rubens TaxID=7604 RepID=UPI001455C483|nr:succinate dehydrogenase assembly factor 3, mitochondrial-like [Asterias rubens]XP_033625067.1 succinate dehydrogenase assembly factor 3, mitochondrial-like [Asterias rubens]